MPYSMIPKTYVGSSYGAKLPLITWAIEGIGNLNATTKWEKIMVGGEFSYEDNKFNS
jgi:hypothetical protein